MINSLSVARRSKDVIHVLSALQTGGLCAEGWSPGQKTLDPLDVIRDGTMVSHFKIEQKLGEGGFAVVHLASDTRLRRKVALKIFRRTEERSPDYLKEARAAAALNVPNVCTVYGIDESEGIRMIVMEYLVGRLLKVLIQEGPVSPEGVVEIGRQVSAGMIAAHDAGIVHGDLKPGNIMITDTGMVKILDFGLAARRRIHLS